MSVIAKIKSRIAELMDAGQSRADAMRIAAKEFGREELTKPIPKPAPEPGQELTEGTALALLDQAVAGIRQRLFPGADPNADLSERLLNRETAQPQGSSVACPDPK